MKDFLFFLLPLFIGPIFNFFAEIHPFALFCLAALVSYLYSRRIVLWLPLFVGGVTLVILIAYKFRLVRDFNLDLNLIYGLYGFCLASGILAPLVAKIQSRFLGKGEKAHYWKYFLSYVLVLILIYALSPTSVFFLIV